ncbi:MAG TPA: FMN-binding protein [Acidimicrobiales bacterium]|nr:FMN-binding protein [Acidimicrobiales bacterium]
MRRAVIATAGTVVGLVLLLGYRSEGAVKVDKVDAGAGTGSTNPGTNTTLGPGTNTGTNTGSSTATTVPTAASSSSDRTYTGQDVSYRYGDIEVAVTVDGSRIVTVSVPQDDAFSPYSQTVNSAAVPILVREAVAAQGLNFDVVSGATYTSDAFAQSLQSALDKASQ